MKKFIKNVAFTLLLAFLFTSKAYAKEPIPAEVKLTGSNIYGRELKAEVKCGNTESYSESCSVELKWYYNNTNSTTGGTLIEMDANYINYFIDESLKGKYIYVVAKFTPTDSENYDEVTLTDITDATNNKTATVGDYISHVKSNEYYSFDIKSTNTVGSEFLMTLNFIKEKDADSYYYVYFSNGDRPTVEQTSRGCTMPQASNGDYSKFKKVFDDNKVYVNDDWNILNGYEKAYVMKYWYDKIDGGNYCELTEDYITLAKPELPELGKRYDIFVFDKNTASGNSVEHAYISTFPLFPYSGEAGSHKLITKIGMINDDNLLKKLANNSSDSINELLKYAQKNEGTTFEYNDEDYQFDVGSYEVVNGKYYFIYTTFENSDGLYRDISDVAVAKAKNNILYTDIDWENSTVENPKTGIENYVIIFAAVVFVGTLAYVKFRKYSKFPQA